MVSTAEDFDKRWVDPDGTPRTAYDRHQHTGVFEFSTQTSDTAKFTSNTLPERQMDATCNSSTATWSKR